MTSLTTKKRLFKVAGKKFNEDKYDELCKSFSLNGRIITDKNPIFNNIKCVCGKTNINAYYGLQNKYTSINIYASYNCYRKITKKKISVDMRKKSTDDIEYETFNKTNNLELVWSYIDQTKVKCYGCNLLMDRSINQYCRNCNMNVLDSAPKPCHKCDICKSNMFYTHNRICDSCIIDIKWEKGLALAKNEIQKNKIKWCNDNDIDIPCRKCDSKLEPFCCEYSYVSCGDCGIYLYNSPHTRCYKCKIKQKT